MSVDKMVEKAKLVLDKQRELNQLVIEMKEEVRAVQQENLALKRRVEYLEEKQRPTPHATQAVAVEPTPDHPEPVPTMEQPKVVTPEVKEIQATSNTSLNPQPIIPVKKTTESSSQDRPFLEFFLGKNVIVKIAAVLMVLAIITFGQIAYVDWLNDVGRFLLIFGIGAFSIGLGVYFDRKDTPVFSSIFYALGLVVLLVDTFLGQFEYELYGNVVHLYSMLALSIAPTIYFHNKRLEFLDTVFIPFHLFLMASPLILFREFGVEVHSFIVVVLLIGATGFALYQQLIGYPPRKSSMVFVDLFVLTVAGMIITLGAGIVVHSDLFNLGHVVVLLYQFYFVTLLLFLNFKRLFGRDYAVQMGTLIATGILLFVLGISINGSFRQITDIDNRSLSVLFTAILLLPIYVRLFLKKDESLSAVTNWYLILTAAFTLFFTFFVNAGYQPSNFNGGVQLVQLDISIKNFILVSETTVLFLAATLTKDRMQRLVSYGFMAVMGLVYLFHFLGHTGDFGWIGANIFFYSTVAAILMYVIHFFFGTKDGITKDILTILVTVMAIPFFTAFGKDVVLDRAPILLGMVVVWLVIVRYLTTLEALKTPLERYRNLCLNIVIILLVLIANFFYLDHDFTTFGDLFTFGFLFLGNAYIVQSLRELFHRAKAQPLANEEWWYIFLFLVGVIIQAVFITQYINFSFDKVILSSYYMIAASIAILFGFRMNWITVRRIGLFAIYFSLAKFFVYDFWANDFDLYVRFLSYFILALVLFGISALYSYLERTYGTNN